MPLSELPEYIRSVRESGQGDDIPVVDMGMIVDSRPRRRWGYALLAVACLVVGTGLYMSTDSIVVASGADARRVAEIVSDEGGSVFSVSQKEDGTYRVRVFSLGGVRSLVERIRGTDGVAEGE
jgi:hypothetical protein